MGRSRKKRKRIVYEKRGTITAYCPHPTKTIEVDGKKYKIEREWFQGIKGKIRVFALNHPIAYASILGVFWALAILSIVGIAVVFVLLAFGKGSARVFYGEELKSRHGD